MRRSRFASFFASRLYLSPLALLLLLYAARPSAAHYSLVDIGSLGGSWGTAASVNDNGQVAGTSRTTAGAYRAFRWSAAEGMVDLGTLAGGFTTAADVNAAGEVVGSSSVAGQPHPYRWSQGVMTELPIPSGLTSARCYNINTAGQIVGAGYVTVNYDQTAKPLLWQNGAVQPLMETPEGSYGIAAAINDAGQVAVYVEWLDWSVHSYLWQNGQARELPGLGAGAQQYVTDVNQNGWCVGQSMLLGGACHAAVWSPAGDVFDLGTIAGLPHSEADEINDKGEIVGYGYSTGSSNYPAVYRGFVYRHGRIVDLNRLLVNADGWTINYALGINNSGQISVQATKGTESRAFLLNPRSVPYLLFEADPQDAVQGRPLPDPVVVNVYQPDGALASDYNGPVTVSLKPGTGTAGATLLGTTTANAVNGVATFSNLAVDRYGLGYVLQAASEGMDSTESASFDVGVPVLYVKPDGSDTNDGTSWATAKATIPAAVSSTLRIAKTEIWVAEGTYKTHFVLSPNGKAYGGFAGTETVRDQRDFTLHKTILQSDTPFEIVFIAGNESVLDGFVIQNGVTGIGLNDGTLVVRNNRIENCSTPIDGSFCTDPLIEENVITGSGTIQVNGQAPIIRRNLVAGSTGRYTTMTVSGLSGLVERNVFRGNATGYTVVEVVGGVTVANNLIYGNDVPGLLCSGGKPLIANNTITRSRVGVRVSQAAPMIVNNVLYGNGTGINADADAIVTLRNNDVFGNFLGNYTGIKDPTGTDGNLSVDPGFVSARWGDSRLQPDSPCRDAGDNSVVAPGGTDLEGRPRILGDRVDMGAYESDGAVIPPPAPRIIRVSPLGDDGKDGLSWPNAKKTVQAAISAAPEAEVWVASGVYPGAVTLATGVELYGGFAGTETSRAQRNPSANASVLDGQGLGQTVTIPTSALDCRVDGFTIRNGNPVGLLSSLVIYATVTNNVFTANAKTGLAFSGNMEATHNQIISNPIGISCSGGHVARNVVVGNIDGGIYMNSDSVIEDNLVVGNGFGIGDAYDHWVGGLYGAIIRNNTIRGNGGDGIVVSDGGAVVRGNAVMHNGGVGLNIRCSQHTATVVNNTVFGNGGQGLYSFGVTGFATLTIANNIIAHNSGVGVSVPSTEVFSHNCVFGNIAGEYAGTSQTGFRGNISADPQILDEAGNNPHLRATSPCIGAGDPSFVLPGDLDIDGQPLLSAGVVDIGADAFTGALTIADAARILKLAGGLSIATPQDLSRLPSGHPDVPLAITTARSALAVGAQP